MRVSILCVLSCCSILSACADAADPLDGAVPPDAPSHDAGPSACAAGANALARSCSCADAGLLQVVGCHGDTATCYAYSSTCVDPGFSVCEAGASAAILEQCRAFCEAHGEEDWAGGCGLVP